MPTPHNDHTGENGVIKLPATTLVVGARVPVMIGLELVHPEDPEEPVDPVVPEPVVPEPVVPDPVVPEPVVPEPVVPDPVVPDPVVPLEPFSWAPACA